MTLDPEVLKNSPRVLAHGCKLMPFARRNEWKLTDGELRRLLEALDLPCSDEMAEFERKLGGWCHAEDVELKGFGFGIALRHGPGRRSSAIAKVLSSCRDVFEGPSKSDESGRLVASAIHIPSFVTSRSCPLACVEKNAPTSSLSPERPIDIGHWGTSCEQRQVTAYLGWRVLHWRRSECPGVRCTLVRSLRFSPRSCDAKSIRWCATQCNHLGRRRRPRLHRAGLCSQ